MTLDVELTDGVVTLRPFRVGDANQLYTAVCESLAELKPWMSWAHDAYSMDEALGFVKIARARWEEKTLYPFAITDAETNDILGGVSLSHINPVYHMCNVGYWVRSSHHGRGVAGRAALLAARYGFEYAGIIRAEIVVALGNEKSRRVAEKISAHYEGILRNRMVIGQTIADACMYSLIPHDFEMAARL